MTLESKIEQTVEQMQQTCRSYQAIAFSHGFGAEDMVLMDLIARHANPIEVFTLDTGRLPEATYRLMAITREKYAIRVKSYYPEQEALQDYLNQHGANAFHQQVTLRKRCCQIRKLEPLKRALKGKDAWITGLRRQQAFSRPNLPMSEWDSKHSLYKINPLLEWTNSDIWAYLYQHDVPYNSLHEEDYPLISCAPCIRPIRMGDSVRSTRWWWENPWLAAKVSNENPSIAACPIVEQQEPAVMA